MKLQAFEASNRKSLQSQMLPRPENRLLLNRFGGSSRPTNCSIRADPGLRPTARCWSTRSLHAEPNPLVSSERCLNLGPMSPGNAHGPSPGLGYSIRGVSIVTNGRKRQSITKIAARVRLHLRPCMRLCTPILRSIALRWVFTVAS
jgi:hypothetical protein